MTTTDTPATAVELSALRDAALARLGPVRPLIAVHRGTGLGMIPENTTGAVLAAVRHGADIVEIDVTRSSDGEYFVYHEGYERRDFGFDHVLGELTAAEIRALRYRWVAPSTADDGFGERAVRVTPLADLLAETPGVVLNIDRSWYHWPEGLLALDATDPTRLLVKVPAEGRLLDMLAAHPVAFPVMIRVERPEELALALARDDVAVVGIELIVRDADSPLADPAVIAALHARGLLAWANALTMRDAEYLGWNDNTSVLRGPEHGWARLVDAGIDVIQTDWPALLRDHRDGRTHRDGRDSRPRDTV